MFVFLFHVTTYFLFNLFVYNFILLLVLQGHFEPLFKTMCVFLLVFYSGYTI